MKRTPLRIVLAAAASALLLLVQTTAYAGRDCEARMPEAAAVQLAMGLAERTARELDASGAEVVVLARAGQDLSRYHLRWSHLGWAYRSGAGWRVVHKLNACGSARADLFRQGLGEFFLDDLFEYRAAYAIPTPELQARLKALLQDNARVALLHTPDYSMLAYPWAQRYQQSNQWAIETLALTQDADITDRGRAQAWLRFRGYEPTVLRLSPMVRLGARVGSANIAFDDHPDAKRWRDRIETVTVDSVFDWLQRAGLAGAVRTVD